MLSSSRLKISRSESLAYKEYVVLALRAMFDSAHCSDYSAHTRKEQTFL
jgi:hypothetical protein